jgi:rare lipoprotein A
MMPSPVQAAAPTPTAVSVAASVPAVPKATPTPPQTAGPAAPDAAVRPAATAAPVAPAVTPAPEGPATYWVQIGAYGEEANAQRLLERLQVDRARLRVDEVALSGRTIYKVLYGPYPTEAEAQAAAAALEQEHGLYGFVLRKAG